MVKGKSNIFGKKESKTQHENQEQAAHEELAGTESMTNETEKMAEQEDVETAEATAQETAEASAEPNIEEQLLAQIKDLQDKHIRLMAEFDNFRKRSMKERSELIKSAGEDILVNILPVIDDFERGLAAMENSQDVEAVKQGVVLIYNKFKDFMAQRGIKEIEALKQDFNVDVHEALTKIPAPEEDLKGKVVDVIQKGYYLNDKVVRYAKVVVGE
ncbi:MAG: nucleotide exchange factor GrpE [Bacteroidota bacterium]|nr:nucleotide exchange factor GrpE [Bacteroidota bacterium]